MCPAFDLVHAFLFNYSGVEETVRKLVVLELEPKGFQIFSVNNYSGGLFISV